MPTVVVTGASHGIGRAIAEAFAAEPDARIALISRNEEKLETVAGVCADKGADAVVFPCDVTDDDMVFETARTIEQEWGAPDVLVNNAGVFKPGFLLDTTPDDFREQVDVNLSSAFVVTQAFLKGMVERERGHIFYSGSVASIKAYPGGVGYCAAKHGLLGLARVVREETKKQGIRVTTMLMGATLTPSWAGTNFPNERFMPPEDMAAAVIQAYKMSGRTVIEEILLRPQLGDV